LDVVLSPCCLISSCASLGSEYGFTCHLYLLNSCHEVVGEILPMHRVQVWRRGAEEAEETVECGGSMWAAVGTPQLGVALRRCLLTGVEPGEEVKYKDWPPPDPHILATFEDGVAVQRVTDAVHASAAQGGNWLPVSDF
jgi:hypothetical protein